VAEPCDLEREAGDAPALAAAQNRNLAQSMPQLVERLDRLNPRLIVTIARGSSDHAASFAGYLFGLRARLPTSSLPPSLASVYGRTLHLEHALALAISQSGASPDLLAAAAGARRDGAFALGVVNGTGSALSGVVEAQIDIGAGSERAVAATKSFVLSLTAIVHLVGAWTRDAVLLRALQVLPEVLGQSAATDWSRAIPLLARHESLFVVGRGPGLPIAREFALKLKEVCGVHAEAVSAAELLHGPVSIAAPSMPAIVLAGDAQAQPSLDAAAACLHAAGAPVVWVSCTRRADQRSAAVVGIPQAPDPLLQPIVAVQAAYPFFAQLARVRGRDPDNPPHLQKITRTR